MSSFTIKCGPSQASRQSRNSLGGYIPRIHRLRTPVAKPCDTNNRFSSLAMNTSIRRNCSRDENGPRIVAAQPVSGSWLNRMSVNTEQVKEKKYPVSRQVPNNKALPRACAYCHDKVNIHHIRDCPILAEKNRIKAHQSRQQKAIVREENLRIAELRMAEKVRVAQEPKATVEVDDSESDDDEDFPRLQAAINSGFVTTRRGSLSVSFKGDNVDTLMKPPCETKIFDSDAPPIAVSSDEDTQTYPDEQEYLNLKRNNTAWKPKVWVSANKQQNQPDENKKSISWSWGNIKKNRDKKERWADICDELSDDEDDEL